MVRIILNIIVAATVLVLGFVALPDAMAQQSKPEIWFVPESHYPPASGSDFLQLFSKPADWARAVKQVQVFGFSNQYFAAPLPLVTEAVNLLDMNHVKIAVTMEMVCGTSLDPAALARQSADKLRSAGGNLRYIVMDEPMLYGHYAPGKGGCHLSPVEAANRAASAVNAFISVFPAATVGDIEPFPGLADQPNWQPTYLSFIEAFNKASNIPITFIQLDFNWLDPHLLKPNSRIADTPKIIGLARKVATFGQSHHLRIGIIINGRASSHSDTEWIQSAKENQNDIAQSGVPFSQLIFQSWHSYPKRSLPDSDPTTFTSLILDYVMNRGMLAVP